MKGFNFPNIFESSAGISIVDGPQDVEKDLKLLLDTEVGEFRYDPGYGCNLKLLKYRPKNQLTKDLMTDAIVETQMFMPNVLFDRDSVKISYTKAGHAEISIPAIIDNNNYITELKILQENI